MIISLSEHFEDFTPDDWVLYLPAIENLLTAHLEGWHFFVPGRRSAAILADLPQLSERHRTVLSVGILERMSVLTGAVRSAPRFVMCLPDGANSTENERAIFLNLSMLNSIENCFKSKLVVENAESDGNFYRAMAEILLDSEDDRSFLSLDVIHGGGGTTVGRVQDALGSPRPCLILVDGDRQYPGDQFGDTAQQVTDAFKNSVFGTHVLFVTQRRSVENYVPLEAAPLFLQGRAESVDRSAAFWQFLCDVRFLDNNDSPLNYYCFRRGFKVKSYRLGDDWFRLVLKELCSRLGASVQPPAYNDNSRDSDCLVPGINARYIELFLEHLEQNEEVRERCRGAFRLSPHYDELKSILECVVAFGLAPRRAPVRLSATQAA